MKKLLLLMLLLAAPAYAQEPRPTAGRLMGGSGVPTINCNPGPTRPDVYVRTGVNPHELYVCSAAPNTWTLMSGSGGGGGLADPGSNALIKRTALNVTAPALAGTDYLAPTGSGSLLTGITKSQIGLSNVDNTSDATKDAAATTLSNKTVVLPIVASFANAQHGHTGPAGGGSLDVAAIGTGTFAKARLHAATVYTDQANTFGAFAQDFRGSDLYMARRAAVPGSPVASQYYQNTGDTKAYFCSTTSTCGEIFVAGLSGPISTSNGGTGNSSLAYVTLTDGATITWTVAGLVNNATVTLGGNRTLAFSGTINGMTGTLIVRQDGSGSRTLTLPAGSKVIGGGAGAITLSTAPNAIDVLTWTFDGASYYFTYGKNFN